jgi:hypothetical protein
VKRKTPSYPRLDLAQVKTYKLARRKSKVRIQDFARPHKSGSSLSDFLSTLPEILAARDLKAVISAVVRAHRQKRMIIAGLGAHVFKVGLNPIIIDLMERGVLKAIALNGAGIIHDFELALVGKTSEDVDREINSGMFGMAEETGRILNTTITNGVKQGMGIGEAVGRHLLSEKYPYYRMSILAAGARLGVPISVHVAIGTDIIQMHPSVDGGAIGQGSLFDFRLLAQAVSRLEGGVYLNIGSAVLLPEVFLKAVTLARNLGYRLKHFTTVNMDFIQHYRPLTNVVKRPTQQGGKGYTLTGHHEIMVPLLAAGIIEEIGQSKRRRSSS